MTTLSTGKDPARTVVVIAQLPPPFHGASATSATIIEHLAPYVELRVADISPGEAKGLARHFVRTWRTLKALRLLVSQGRSPKRILYHPIDGGVGLVYSIMVASLAALLGYTTFLHHHSFAYVDRGSRLMAILAWIQRRRGTHIVLCPAMADGLAARYPIRETYELSNAALLPPLLHAKVRDGDKRRLRLGFLSNLIVEKGLDTSIDLMRAALAEGLPVELRIAGAAPDRRPLDLIDAAAHELGESIIYLGPLYGEEKDKFLDDTDIFLFPSRYVNEAQPRVVIESLARGLPVLTVARGCIEADVRDGGGLCVPSGADFVEAALPLVRQWCSDPRALDRAGTQALERARVLHRKGGEQLAGLTKILAGNGRHATENNVSQMASRQGLF